MCLMDKDQKVTKFYCKAIRNRYSHTLMVGELTSTANRQFL